MKPLFVVLIIVLVVSVTRISQAQTIDLTKKITITANNKPLGEVLKELDKKAGLNLAYNPSLIPINKYITFTAKNQTVKEILDGLLPANNIEYMVLNNNTILKPIPVKTETTNNEQQNIKKLPEKFTISGFIHDKLTGEVLIGVTVAIDGKKFGSVTNDYGFYSISLPLNDYLLLYSYLGYKPLSYPVTLKYNQKANQLLEPDTLYLKTLQVETVNDENFKRIAAVEHIKIKTIVLKNVPSVAGEADIIKTLHCIPGVQLQGDGSVGFNVRGGNKDENLIIIDEAPVYNPSHLFGFFSAININSINDLKIFKNDFPIAYGGRLSSVIDIKTKDGNQNQFSLSGNINPFATSLCAEGPIVKEKASYFATIRQSNTKWIFGNSARDSKISFNDINLKLNYTANHKNRFYFNIFTGNDYFDEFTNETANYAIEWNNFASSFRWNHIFNKKIFSNVTLLTSQYKYLLHISELNADKWETQIGSASIKNDFTWYRSPGNTIKFGYNLVSHSYNPGKITPENTEAKIIPGTVAEGVLYAGSEHKFNKLTFNYGLRYISWNNYGPAILNVYNTNYDAIATDTIKDNRKINTYRIIEPRLNLIAQIYKNTSLQLSYNRTSQNEHLITNSLSPFTTVEVWMPSNKNIKPEYANLYSAGFFYNTNNRMYEASAEFFYKQFSNQIFYTNHPNLLFNPLLEGELRFGTAKSEGIELALKKNSGNLTGWITYTYSKSTKKSSEVNFGNTYRANFDKPHYLNCFLNYTTTNKRWGFSWSFIYHTGIPITTPVGFYYYNGYQLPLYGAKNNERLPDYHRMDLSVNFRINKNETRKYQHSVSLSLYNVYGRKNPISVNFNKIKTDNNGFVIPSAITYENQIYPTKIYLLGFIPSVNYSFKLN